MKLAGINVRRQEADAMQQTFDWSRAEQLGTLDKATLPPRPGISSGAMKGVLRAIDSHGRGRECWPSEATIAAGANVSLRTCKRAIKALIELSVLCVERRGHLTLNHYRIVWTELALLVPNEVPRQHNEVPRWHQRSATVALETYKQTPKENQLTAGEANAGLVELVLSVGVKKAKAAIDAATANGLNEATIRERVQRWRELPDSNRSPGTLYNWLALRGSFEAALVEPVTPPRQTLRGDAITKTEQERNRLRWRIVRSGRQAGASEEEIDRRCQMAGV